MKDKIKAFFNSKAFYIGLSVALAICAWLLVLSYTNPIKTRTLDIQIQFLNQDAPANLDLQNQTASYPKTVTVTVSGREDVVNSLSAAELVSTVDFSEVSRAGVTKLNISKPECERFGITVEDYAPKTINFTFDTVTEKNFDVRIKYDNSLLKEGYAFSSVTADVSSISVPGLASLLETCDYVEVDLANSIAAGSLDADKAVACLGRFISKTGADITKHFTEKQITVNIKVAKAKKLTLGYTLTGTPKENYYVGNHWSTPAFVYVTGDEAALNALPTVLNLGSISVQDKSQTEEKTLSIGDKLPAGVKLVQEGTTAKVTVAIQAYETKQITVAGEDIRLEGADLVHKTYDIKEETISVTLRGRQEDLRKITAESLKPVVNVTAQTESGSWTLPITFADLDQNVSLVSAYTCTVVIADKDVGEPVPQPLQTDDANP